MQTNDSSFAIGQIYFGNDGTQNYSVFQPLIKYYKVHKTTNIIVISWKSKVLSKEIIKFKIIINFV